MDCAAIDAVKECSKESAKEGMEDSQINVIWFTAAKAALSMLKNIPGINIGATVLNAVMAGCIVASLGEGTVYVFEQVYLGNKTFDDMDWVKKVLESKLSGEFVEIVKEIINKIGEEKDLKKIAKIILKLFNSNTAKK